MAASEHGDQNNLRTALTRARKALRAEHEGRLIAERKVDIVTGKFNKAQTTIAELNQYITDLENTHAVESVALTADYDEAQSRIDELERENTDLNEEVQQLKSALHRYEQIFRSVATTNNPKNRWLAFISSLPIGKRAEEALDNSVRRALLSYTTPGKLPKAKI